MAIGEAAAAHLLRRAAMGGHNTHVRQFARLTREEAVDRLLDTSSDPALPGWSQFANSDDWRAQDAMIDWWVDRMITSSPTVSEKLTLFWHSHFSTAREKVEDAQLMWDQHLVLRQRGLGSFRTLLEKVSFGSAMLIYLDNETNVAGAEQENFARELMELHTIGNGRFVEGDVIAMARAWTGHNTVGRTAANNWQYDPSYIFRSAAHDNGQKTLFGITKNWGAQATLDELCTGAKASESSDFIARKMFQFYVHSNPSQDVIDGLAATWRSNNLDVASLLRSILLHDEFWAASSRYALVKSPVEFMVEIMRRIGYRSSDESVRWRMEGMGMTLFDPPSEAGWGRNSHWLSTATSWTKSRWINSLKWRAEANGWLQGLEAMTADDAADAVIAFFGIYEVSDRSREQVRDLIVATIAEHPWAMRHEPFAVGMFMPEVQCA